MTQPIKWIVFLGIPVILLALTFIMPLNFSYVNSWVCRDCCSFYGHTKWIGILETDSWSQTTKMNQWLVKNEGGHVHDWVNIQGTGRDIWGNNRLHSHDFAPPIHTARNYIDDFVKYSTDDEIKSLISAARSYKSNAREEVDKVVYKFVKSRLHQ